jgi:hypothetical protein
MKTEILYGVENEKNLFAFLPGGSRSNDNGLRVIHRRPGIHWPFQHTGMAK